MFLVSPTVPQGAHLPAGGGDDPSARLPHRAAGGAGHDDGGRRAGGAGRDAGQRAPRHGQGRRLASRLLFCNFVNLILVTADLQGVPYI